MNAFRAYMKAINQRRLMVLACGIVGLVAASIFAFVRSPSYSASTDLYVSSQQDNNVTAAYQGNLLSQERTKSYTQLLQSDRVYDSVIQQLGLNTNAAQLRKSVDVNNDTDSVIISVTTTENDPGLAASITNSISSNFISLVNDLERPTGPNQIQPTVVRVVQPAAPPEAPSSLNPFVASALGLVAGLIVGVVAAILWSLLDTAVRSTTQLRDLFDRPVLGVIAKNSSAPNSDSLDISSYPLEALRQLRTNLQFVRVTQSVRSLVITSSKPAEGKTTTVLCLAQVLGQSGHRVLVVDGDLRRPRVASALNLEGEVGLTSVLSGRTDSRSAIQAYSGFDVLASGAVPPNPSELLGSENMKKLLHQLGNLYDTILIDTPPCLAVTDPVALSAIADAVLLVCRYGSTKLDEIRRAMELMADVEAPVLGTVLNMVPRSASYSYGGYFNYRQPETIATGPNSLPDQARTVEVGRTSQIGGRRPIPHRREN